MQRYYVETEIGYDLDPVPFDLAEDNENLINACVQAKVINLNSGQVGHGSLNGIAVESMEERYLGECLAVALADAKAQAGIKED
jgi:hypothetical protein